VHSWRYVTVAEVVEAYPWKPTYPPNQICKLMSEACGLFGLAINPPADQCVARLPNTKG
jgi:hypothetical protein